MRILEITSGLGLGGSEISILERLKVPSEHRTIILSTKPRLRALLPQIQELVEVKTSNNLFQLMLRMRQLSFTFNPEVIVSHNPLNTILVGAYLKLTKRAALVHVAHSDHLSGSWLRIKFIEVVQRILQPQIAGCIAVSTSAAKSKQTMNARVVITLHLGGRLWPKSPEDTKWPLPGQKHWLAIGRLVESKQFDLLVRSFALVSDVLRAQGVSLVIIGDGPQRDQIQSLISQNSLEDVVVLLSSNVNIGPFYNQTDLLIITSRYEGGPLTLYEGLVAGCRVAGTYVGAIPELLARDNESFLIKLVSTKDLSYTLEQLSRMEPLDEFTREERRKQFSFLRASNQASLFYQAISDIMLGR